MVKKIFYITLSIIVVLAIYLNVFELLLYNFQSPINSEIQEPLAHLQTWRYLLYQKYMSFIELDIFDIHEKRHLLDVKRVFKRTHIVWMFSSSLALLILVIFFKKIVKIVSILGLSLNAIFILFSFNFSNSFNFFHTIFFKDYSWVFLKSSILIEWFPLIYFQEFFSFFLIINFSFFMLLKLIVTQKYKLY